MRKIIYTLFPSLMPKVWRTKGNGHNYITYIWDEDEGLFVGSNNVRLSLGYVIKNLIPKENENELE